MSCNCDNKYTSDVSIHEYTSEVQPTWCGGCGNYGIWTALKRSLVELGLKPKDVLLAFDIGCNGNMSDKIRGYRIHSLHGRVLPLAAAAKIANPDITVIAMAGDGATYSEGINHFVNSVRNNFPITFLVHDNGNYGLTTGQASATTPQGAKRTANPQGPTASTLNPVELALSLNPSFVARAFSGNIQEMTEIIKDAIQHQKRGFGYVNIQQPCPTYNKETDQYYYLEKCKSINEYQNYSNTDITQAREIGAPLGSEIMTGVLYKNENVPNYIERIEHEHSNEVKKYEISEYLKKFQ